MRTGFPWLLAFTIWLPASRRMVQIAKHPLLLSPNGLPQLPSVPKLPFDCVETFAGSSSGLRDVDETDQNASEPAFGQHLLLLLAVSTSLTFFFRKNPRVNER